jgi:hypothetical protein
MPPGTTAQAIDQQADEAHVVHAETVAGRRGLDPAPVPVAPVAVRIGNEEASIGCKSFQARAQEAPDPCPVTAYAVEHQDYGRSRLSPGGA